MNRGILFVWLAALSVMTSAIAGERIEYLNSSGTLPDNLPFSAAVRVGNTLYLSGQVGVLPGTMKLAPGGLEAEALQVMKNIEAVLHANGYKLKHLVKCTVMLADIADWAAFNVVYQDFLQKPYPARSAFGTSGLGLGARLEVECMAAKE